MENLFLFLLKGVKNKMGLIKDFKWQMKENKRWKKKLQSEAKATYVNGKKVKPSLAKGTTNYSGTNNIHIGYEVGSGKLKKRFASEMAANKYASKLLKMKNSKSVMSKPLYYGRRD